MRIAILDDYQQAALRMANWSELGPAVHIEAIPDHIGDPVALAHRLHDVDCVVLMRERTQFRGDLMARLPKLRLIVVLGHKNNTAVDFDAAAARGITVCGTRPAQNAAAELTWALILALARKVAVEDAAVRRGRWQTELGIGLNGKVLGLLGLGKLGSAVARIGQAFGMRVIAWSPNLTDARASAIGVERVDKATLFEGSDFVSIHLVLSAHSRGLVGAAELSCMKRTAYLINTSRGPIVDEAALVDVLRSRRIAGAGLDVFDIEPLPAGHALATLENVVLTPHIGYVTEENYRHNFGDALEDIRAFLAGTPIRVVSGH